MLRKAILCALASAAMIPASAALAQHGPGGGHGGPGGGMGNAGGLGGTMGNAGGMGHAGGLGTGNAGIGMLTRDDARINSQGAANASATGIAHANANSVLAGTSTGSTLAVTTGMPVLQNGIEIGTVQRVITNNHGVIVRVLVRSMTGQMFSLSPNSLALSGTTLTTTAMLRTR
jgi:hypothetical protein